MLLMLSCVLFSLAKCRLLVANNNMAALSSLSSPPHHHGMGSSSGKDGVRKNRSHNSFFHVYCIYLFYRRKASETLWWNESPQQQRILQEHHQAVVVLLSAAFYLIFRVSIGRGTAGVVKGAPSQQDHFDIHFLHFCNDIINYCYCTCGIRKSINSYQLISTAVHWECPLRNLSRFVASLQWSSPAAKERTMSEYETRLLSLSLMSPINQWQANKLNKTV